MTSQAQYSSSQLQSWLQQLSLAAEPELAAQAHAFLREYEQMVQRQTEKYSLLNSFGLANDQLVKFAQCEGYSDSALQQLLMTVLAVDADAALAILRQA